MSAYLSAVIADAPRHYWRLADQQGLLAHDVGSTPFQLTTAGTIPILGYSGPVSDGGSGFFPTGIDLNSALGTIGSITTPLSVELWFWAMVPQPTQRYLLAWDGSTPNAFQMFWNTDGTVQVQCNGVFPAKSAVLPTQAWHHFVGTADGANLRQYVDGALSTSIPLGAVTVNRGIGIGAEPSAVGQSFEGAIAEVAIYATALSAGRVAAHFAAADRAFQSPVFGGSGGIGGAGSSVLDPNYAGILQEILQAVKKTF